MYDDELPAGYQDADLEMAELDRLADEALARDKREAAAKAAAEKVEVAPFTHLSLTEFLDAATPAP